MFGASLSTSQERAPGAAQIDLLPVGEWLLLRMPAGRHVRVTALDEVQVVALWAYDATNLERRVSMTHSQALIRKVFLEPGDLLVASDHGAILRVFADISHGRHDSSIPACSPALSRRSGPLRDPPSCTARLSATLSRFGVEQLDAPQPWNLFMTTSVAPNGSYATREPACCAGDYVELRAEIDCLVLLSSCAHGMSRTGHDRGGESSALVMTFIPHGG
ncbi:urea carboxylase-associated family protein [Phenylobacterium sp. LjRoot225]|uniref:DUF1989 domain-containing protein n=1 Tax=Phenylobacterium sp. LjRoot225 TaxID=3342285 RepID=UPI003ECEFC19